MDLDFVRIECEVITDSLAPPAASTALFNHVHSFEALFKELCCLMNTWDLCATCTAREVCPYTTIFNQALSYDPEIVRLHQKPSLPFALSIDTEAGIRVGLVIIGTALQYIEIFHSALQKMVTAAISMLITPAHFTLCFSSLDYQGIGLKLPPDASVSDNVVVLSGQHVLQSGVHSDSARLLLKSPLRLLHNGAIAHRFDFAPFFRSQLRRCSSLFAYYGTGALDLDFVRLSRDAEEVILFDNTIRYTQPPWTKLQNKAGLSGLVECLGLIEPMFSLLLLGSYFNAGKGAAFGAGFHLIEVQ